MNDELTTGGDPAAGTPSPASAVPRRVLRLPGKDGTVAVREDVLHTAAAAVGFVAGAGGVAAAMSLPLQAVGLRRRTPVLKGSGMRNRKLNAQLAPAMYSLAATNAQLLGLVGSRRPLLTFAKFGIAAAGVAYLTADEEQRKAMIAQATALIEQGADMLSSTGVLDKVFK